MAGLGRPKKGSAEEKRIHKRNEEIRRRHREEGLGAHRLGKIFKLTTARIQQILKEE